jgi:hypothetical protein
MSEKRCPYVTHDEMTNLIQRLVMCFLPSSDRYTYAMMKAIDKAREPVWIGEQRQSKADGLRVIRRFERVNKTAFNPFNGEHLGCVEGNASHEAFFRKAGYVFGVTRT